jgi:hypothetical protein
MVGMVVKNEENQLKNINKLVGRKKNAEKEKTIWVWWGKRKKK